MPEKCISSNSTETAFQIWNTPHEIGKKEKKEMRKKILSGNGLIYFYQNGVCPYAKLISICAKLCGCGIQDASRYCGVLFKRDGIEIKDTEIQTTCQHVTGYLNHAIISVERNKKLPNYESYKNLLRNLDYRSWVDLNLRIARSISSQNLLSPQEIKRNFRKTIFDLKNELFIKHIVDYYLCFTDSILIKQVRSFLSQLEKIQNCPQRPNSKHLPGVYCYR